MLCINGRMALCLLIIAICAACFACRAENEKASAPKASVSFASQGILIRLEKPLEVDSVRVLNSLGRVEINQRYGNGLRKSFKLSLAWQHGAAYQIEFRVKGKTLIVYGQAPSDPPLGAAVHFSMPYSGRVESFGLKGLQKNEKSFSTAAVGSTITGGLTLQHYSRTPAMYKVSIDLPRDLELVEAPPGCRIQNYEQGLRIMVEQTMETSNPLAYFVFRVKLLEQRPMLCQARVIRKFNTGKTVFTRTIRLSGIPAEEIRNRIQVDDLSLPTLATGFFDAKSMPDTLFFGSGIFRRLGKLLGINTMPRNYWTPYTYQTVRLSNSGQEPFSVLVTSRITVHGGSQVPAAFLPPDQYTGKLKDKSVAITASIPPKSAVTVVLPVFVSSVPKSGVYDRLINIYPMGSSLIVHKVTSPLYVKTTDIVAVGVVVGSLVLSLCGLVFFVFKFKKLIAGMQVQHLVVISFFGAVTFAGINVPLKIFNSVITALFGPFSVLILGFFNDLIYFSMLIALLRLVPRPGVVTLAFLVRYLLSGMMLGGFHVLDFLYMGTALVLKEGALYAAGVTRKQEDFEWTFFRTLLTALLLGTADALINASSVYLHVIFYRLYFAKWYIFLTILFNGFVYTGMGVFFGRRFSNTLKMVQE